MQAGMDGGMLFQLVCAYRQQAPVQQLVNLVRLLDGGTASLDAQQVFQTACLQDPICKQFPLSPDYLRRALKAIVLAAEADGREIADELLELHTSLLLSSTSLEAQHATKHGWSYKTYAYGPAAIIQTANHVLVDPSEAALQMTHPGPSKRCRNHPATQQAPEPCCNGDNMCTAESNHAMSPASANSDDAIETSCNPQSCAISESHQLEQDQETQPDVSRGTSHKQAAENVLTGEEESKCQHAQQLVGHAPGELMAMDQPRGDGNYGLISLHVSQNMFEGSTGCHEWEAGFFLAEFVLNHPDRFRGKHCVELGCGSGMVGVCVSRVGAASALLTDGDEGAVENCRANLLINGVWHESVSSGTEHKVQCEVLRWEDGANLHPDVILAADVLYDPDVIPALVKLLIALLQQPKASQGCNSALPQHWPVAYIATTLRNEATLAEFLRVASCSLLVQDITACMQSVGTQFLHNQKLQGRRSSIYIHQLQLCR